MPAKKMPALSMSQTKEDLVRYLGLRPETYALMAKETDIAYKWLTTGTQHLKSNCTRDPPYDWSDITELSKEQAMIRLAQSGDAHTSAYWAMGNERTADGCPNWIARWFLYHKFRYRDGRNRGKESKSQKSGASSKGRTKHHAAGSSAYYYQDSGASSGQSIYSGYSPQSPVHSFTASSFSSTMSTPTMSHLIGSAGSENGSTISSKSAVAQSASFYDPVKGVWVPKD